MYGFKTFQFNRAVKKAATLKAILRDIVIDAFMKRKFGQNGVAMVAMPVFSILSIMPIWIKAICQKMSNLMFRPTRKSMLTSVIFLLQFLYKNQIGVLCA
jgi:hypothetical protein